MRRDIDLKKASRYAILINAVQIAAAAAIALLVLFTDLEQRAGWRYVSALVCVSALLVVCGGGHVGTCVLRAAKLTGFELWLFDDRPQEAVAEAAALADRLGVEYQYGGNVVTWFSLLLFRDEPPTT